MLEKTFCHIKGVGEKGERKLWEAGCDSWERALDGHLPFRGVVADRIRQGAEVSLKHLARKNPLYFYYALPSNQLWRMFPAFRDRVAYLDIETTGLGQSDSITTVVVYDCQKIYPYVQGDTLNNFRTDIRQFELLVTYNGKTFDLPFIRRYLKMPMQQAHIDLRYILRSLGYKGGLKSCERQMGLDRGGLKGVDGYTAVLLWADFTQRGNAHALETLLAYNTEDVINLEALMIMAYNLLIGQTPFSHLQIELPAPPSSLSRSIPRH
jgi:uncharacterized protein YprB with RNaseH-like and TPR domain